MPEEILTLTDDQIVVIRLSQSNISSTVQKSMSPDDADLDSSGDDSTGENDPDPA